MDRKETLRQMGTINGLQSTATTLPDAEDINRDNNMDNDEDYFQYEISLRPGNMIVGQNYIDEIGSSVRFEQHQWYREEMVSV